MNSTLKSFWSSLTRRGGERSLENIRPRENPLENAQVLEMDLPANDPLLAYLLSTPGVIEVDRLKLGSALLDKLKAAGVKICVPLVSQGELIGLLNLGPRRSEQEYSLDDRHLLNTLATQAAPALRVAQLVRQQQGEARERERIDQELRVARVIQETLLPRQLPEMPGWSISAHWQPARAVSGDFYDFIQFPDGRLGILVGDVTDKGMPAALVMATTRSILRAAAEQLIDPGKVLARANNKLAPDIPANMFVTCLYGLLEPSNGRFVFANAGHNIPYRRTPTAVSEIKARGMPLGLMMDMVYEEQETRLDEGDNLILYSDGIVEAHNPQGEMFGFPRLHDLLMQPGCGDELIHCLLDELSDFTGAGWEQEDDVTFVTVERKGEPAIPVRPGAGWRKLAEFEVPSQPGNERQAIQKVADATTGLGLADATMERLKTAVGEATMNAMEYGNRLQADIPARLEVLASADRLMVRVIDQGGEKPIVEKPAPDLEAKLAGEQSPRGWGLFLIKNMVDDVKVSNDGKHHIMELIINLEGEQQ